MRILVVDDDNIIRRGLIKVIEKLNDENIVVNNFQNGLLAFEYLKENDGSVDLVITDVKMPIMTGIDLIEKSIDELKNPPLFVVLSGYDEFSYVRDTIKFGAFNYLLKPIKKDELNEIIEEAKRKIKEVKSKEELLSKSVEVLKKDLFKNILFSNKEIGNKNVSSLLENMQLDENYIYKLIVVDRYSKDNSGLISIFMKNLLDICVGIESSLFYYKDSVYILLYINTKEFGNIDEIIDNIVKNTDLFIENKMNVYILETIDEVWKIRKQANLIRKVKENILEDIKPNKYLLDNEEKISKVFLETSDSNNVTAIKLAKDYIIDNFNKNITLKDVADEVFLSQNYLSELFKKEIGEGFYDFLSKYRIKKAKEILITTNLRVYEVAQKVGYNDAITFGRAFKKITGMTPNNFRNNLEEE